MNHRTLFVVFAALFACVSAGGAPLAKRVDHYLRLQGVGAEQRAELVQKAKVVVCYSSESGETIGAWDAPVPRPTAAQLEAITDSVLALAAEADVASAEAAHQAAKSPDQLALEAEYFEAADALHVLAGEAAPTNDEPASLSAVKAKVKKAKGSKGGSKKADDYLEIQASHVDLLTLDLELRTYDPGWRAKAKRPKD